MLMLNNITAFALERESVVSVEKLTEHSYILLKQKRSLRTAVRVRAYLMCSVKLFCDFVLRTFPYANAGSRLHGSC